MKLLALDTSSDACTVVLRMGDEVAERHDVAPRRHRELLLPFVTELLADAAIRPQDLDAIVVGNGPGSFIGLRIAVSVAQGIAFAAERPLVPICSLLPIAVEALDAGAYERSLVAQDARMGEVYLAEFTADADGLAQQVGDTVLHAIDTPIVPLAGAEVVAGGAWSKHATLGDAAGRSDCAISDIVVPRATMLLGLGARAFEQGAALPPDKVEPAYVRKQVATPPAPEK